LNSAAGLMVFMPASVKKGDIFAGSSRAEVPVDAPARADTAEIESDKAVKQTI